jgi:predicted RNA-binding protein (virulence factor B family)
MKSVVGDSEKEQGTIESKLCYPQKGDIILISGQPVEVVCYNKETEWLEFITLGSEIEGSCTYRSYDKPIALSLERIEADKKERDKRLIIKLFEGITSSLTLQELGERKRYILKVFVEVDM